LTWNGAEILIAGGINQSTNDPIATAFAFNPATNQTRALPPMPTSRHRHVAVWTGRQLVIWGGGTSPYNRDKGTYAVPRNGVAYDPVRNTWSAMPASPLRGRIGADAAWTGTAVLIWGGFDARSPNAVLTDGATYTPTA